MDYLNSMLLIIHSNLWENIFTRIQQGHGILITIIGLAAVFFGLVMLWALTSNFQRIIPKIERRSKKKRPSLQDMTSKIADEEKTYYNEISAAIGIALYCELEDEIPIITLRHIEQEMSPWIVASRSSTMRHS